MTRKSLAPGASHRRPPRHLWRFSPTRYYQSVAIVPLRISLEFKGQGRETYSLFHSLNLTTPGKQLTQAVWHGRRIRRERRTFWVRREKVEEEEAEIAILQVGGDVARLGRAQGLALIGEQLLVVRTSGRLLEPNILRHSIEPFFHYLGRNSEISLDQE